MNSLRITGVSTIPADTTFTPEALQSMVGKRVPLTVRFDWANGPIGWATVLAAEERDGLLRLTLEVEYPEGRDPTVLSALDPGGNYSLPDDGGQREVPVGIGYTREGDAGPCLREVSTAPPFGETGSCPRR